MPLHLVHGPPNSGRAGVIRKRFLASLGRDPVLVVPNRDDVYSFERELCAQGALLGGTVLGFEALFGEVARAAGQPPRPTLTAAQRVRLLRSAVAAANLGPLARSAQRPGFAVALDELVEDLQAAGLDPASVAAGAATLEASAYLGDLAALYQAYAQLRDSVGREDSHTLARAAIAALRRDPDSWGGRPVLLYGFDDLTVEQLELVGALVAATEVTVGLTYEDRAALAARAGLLQKLRELGTVTETRTDANPSNTDSPLLFALERGLFEPGAKPVAAVGGLEFLRAAGTRGEAELIGARIARLLCDGARPEAIAVAVRDPDRRGVLLARVLEAYGIPVALEADLAVSGTATGTCLLALLRAAFTSARAEDLLAYLRGPRRAAISRVDWLERAIRRRRLASAEQASEAWTKLAGEPPRDLLRVREAAARAGSLLPAVAELARDISQWPIAFEDARGTVPPAAEALELRAADTIADALEQLTELDGHEPTAEELIATVEALTMPLWSGPPEGRVRIASPYRLRASRFAHLFVASLQDGEFPRHDSDGPFLSDEQRAALGLPERAEAEAEERYLFYSSVSLPTESLHLSFRASDEAGGAEARSPFIAELRRLLDPPPPDDPDEPDPVEAEITESRGLGDVLFVPAEAPSERELGRSLAAAHEPDPPRTLARLGIDPDRAARLLEKLGAAAAVEKSTREPGPLRVQAVKEALSAVDVYGGTTLEGFDVCSYRWFVNHELAPEALDPRPEGLTQGTLMHEAIERLYGERPGGDAIPRPASLSDWTRRGSELVAELSAELSSHPADRAMRRRVERLLIAFLRREARRENPQLLPSMLEAGFDDAEGADRPALRIDGWGLHGRIDRVDAAGGRGLVLDYKLSRVVTPAAKFVEKGTLQLPLYLLALRELWGIDPVGGLYQPLRSTNDPSPRGMVREEDRELLDDLDLVGTDVLSAEEFDAALDEAASRAGSVVERMRAGDIRRDPGPPAGLRGHNQCPTFCTFAPICRRERAPVEALAPIEEERETS
jgi:ATP-dependent helicase/DNAse subunit B